MKQREDYICNKKQHQPVIQHPYKTAHQYVLKLPQDNVAGSYRTPPLLSGS
jgi:hypothetical protein